MRFRPGRHSSLLLLISAIGCSNGAQGIDDLLILRGGDSHARQRLGVADTLNCPAWTTAIKRLVADKKIGRDEAVVLFNTGGALKYLDLLRT